MQLLPALLLLFLVGKKCESFIFNNVVFSVSEKLGVKTEKIVLSNELSDGILEQSYHFLECVDQEIPIFPSNSVGNFSKLKRLFFKTTNTSEIQSGAFSGFPKLKVLEITGNSLLRTIPGNAFQCPNLLLLNLSSNVLEHLDQNILEGVPKLRKLDVSFNRLTMIQPALFSHTPFLYDLHFSRNLITDIPEGAFKYLEGPRNFSALFGEVNVTIFLDSNEIANFSELAFGNGAKIDYLLLAGNKLENFDVLRNVESVEWLELTQNRIECLEYASVEKVKVLMVDLNPWDCDCLKRLREKLWNSGKVFFANTEYLRCTFDKIKLVK